MYEDDAIRGAHKIADLADWTLPADELQRDVSPTELYDAIKARVPGGSMEANLTIVEESISRLDGPTALRVFGVGKDLIIRGLEMWADQDINNARARGTYARYTALTTAGFSEAMAEKIIVAEASVPWPELASSARAR